MVLYSFVFAIGASIGSFLNVVVYRVPRNKSIVTPRSKCTSCNKSINWYHNIPILSFLLLGGKCNYCKEKYSINYFLVELLTAFITLFLFINLSFTIEFIFMCLVCYTFIVLSFIDFEFKAVPDTLLLLLLVFAFASNYNDILSGLYGALLFAGGFIILNFFITYYIQNIKSKILKDESLKSQKALGEGDIPVVATIGAILGIKAGLVAIFLAAILAIIPSIYNSITKKDRETPFIPYLFFGFILEYLFKISKVVV